jgi:alkanesulfonate monooxygenase SsuD/methylene tetrahydromethanopterin reductase-like flavin-dependent oxidoreductase (luciferase family)
LQSLAEQEALLKDPAGGGLTAQLLRDQAAKGIAPPNQAQIIIGRIMQGEPVADEEVFHTLSLQDSLIVGSPETCRAKMKIYKDLGIDRLMCFHQVGSIPHDKVMKSIRLIGEMIPEL